MAAMKYTFWRQSVADPMAPAACGRRCQIALEEQHVFPSGRQAVTEIVGRIVGGRAARVAIPEWSSHCVISAVGRIATPIPLREALAGDHAVDAVLVYDQYGWPKSHEALSVLSERLKASVIHDCVDNPIGPATQLPEGVSHRVWSFSKTLGFANGGAAIDRNGYLEWSDPPDAVDSEREAAMAHSLEPIEREFAKSWLGYRDRMLLAAVRQRTLSRFIDREVRARQALLEIFLESPLAAGLPEWMAVADGAAPNAVPVLEDAVSDEERVRWIQGLRETFGLESRAYHFDFSDDPLHPVCRPALVLPIHGEIDADVFSKALTYLRK